MQYKVVVVWNKADLEETLNDYASEGWTFNSLEREYTKYVVIFEKV